MRTEAEIFSDLSMLCKSSGYVHAASYFFFRDQLVVYSNGGMTPEDMQHLFSMTRLVRTEISTLIGLMVQSELDFTKPPPDIFQQYIEKTEILLKELHYAFPMFKRGFNESSELDVFGRGDFLREPIFYGGESAYSFQYRDFSVPKYIADRDWLISNQGFSIEVARDVVLAIQHFQHHKTKQSLTERELPPLVENFSLSMLTFNVSDIAEISGISHEEIVAVLNAFTLSSNDKNEHFQALHDFNITNAKPIIRINENDFLLIQQYSLMEALYESPFYWMWNDENYKPTLLINRGKFTEAFCCERLELVFGKANVYRDVEIEAKKGQNISDIDVLVLFGDRAIVLQAKSKQLTLAARKGNDSVIQNDFKKSIQDSYGQGLLCAKNLINPNVKLVAKNSEKLEITHNIKEIYILCVVLDHYPALNNQVRHFLKFETTSMIQAPLVLDVFALDAMTEMLQSPLHFLSYLKRRASYQNTMLCSRELVALAYHLKYNLWFDEQYDMVMLGDDISTDLDIAMLARREGIKGKTMPDGVFKRLASTTLGQMIEEMNAKPTPETIELGLFLLQQKEQVLIGVSQQIDRMIALARQGQSPCGSAIFESGIGLTIGCNETPDHLAANELRAFCLLRKYTQKATRWFGICISPYSPLLRFGLALNFPWQPDEQIDLIAASMLHSGQTQPPVKSNKGADKIGRNDPCLCGSGRKYKKCCLARGTP